MTHLMVRQTPQRSFAFPPTRSDAPIFMIARSFAPVAVAAAAFFVPAQALFAAARAPAAIGSAATAAARGGGEAESEGAGPESGAYAITHVNVVPMDRERVLADQTVLVRDGKIVRLGSAGDVAVPEGATRIDGRGRWLMPGLADMHAHLFSDDAFPDSLAPDELAVMLANGVTTVRFMIGTPEQLELRSRVAAGELLGPTIYSASPQLSGKAYGEIFNGRVVTTPEEARAAVREVSAAGYDFVKLTYLISRPVYDAVVETAREVGIPVIGHVDPQVGLERALEAGQQIEHLDSYMEAILADDAPSRVSVSTINVWKTENWLTLDHVDEAKIAEVAAASARAGVTNTPTLTFFKLVFGIRPTAEQIRAFPEWRFLSPGRRAEMESGFTWKAPPTDERRRRYVELRNRITKAIHDAGGRILAGSDSPDWFLLYGFSLHRELANLVEAGLTPYEALEAATRNPAEWLGASETFGTIAEGRHADLLLLEANPLERVGNARKRVGVMVRGRWLPESELRAMLDRAAPRFQAGFEATG
jgi:imidazolonepropionase-like amidohydrolase